MSTAFTKESKIAAIQQCYKDIKKVPTREQYIEWRANLPEPESVPSGYGFRNFGSWQTALLCSGLIPLLASADYVDSPELQDVYVVEAEKVKAFLEAHGIAPPFADRTAGLSDNFLYRVWGKDSRKPLQFVPLVFVDKICVYLQDPAGLIDGRLPVRENPLLGPDVISNYHESSKWLATED